MQGTSVPKLRQQYPKDQRENLEPLIQRLHIDKNRTFAYAANILPNIHDFYPTRVVSYL
jgi:hypothetical protein